MADCLFVVGLSLDVAGALLVIMPLLLPIVRRRWDELALTGYLFTRGGPVEDDMRDSAYTLVGGLLVAVGFLVLLAGYVVAADDARLAAVAVAIIFVALVAGGRFAAGPVKRWLFAKASQNDPVTRDDS